LDLTGWLKVRAFNHWIFGLRLEPSITEFGVRMTDLLQTGFFQLIYGKFNQKT